MTAAVDTLQERHSSLPRGRLALFAVLLLGAAVRCWRLGWGLDQQMAFPDETGFWASYLFAFLPPGWSSLFGHSLYYPTLYGYLVAAAVAVSSMLGIVGPAPDVFAGLLVARVVSAIAGLVTIVVVARIGQRGYGSAVGLLAAALMAAIPMEALQTHYASVDVLLGTTTALTMLAACALARDRCARRAFVAGACAALAFATKYNAGVLLAAPAWVLIEVAFAERSPRRVFALGSAMAAGFAVALVIACPPWIFETARVLGQMRWIRFMSTSGAWLPDNNHLGESLGWYGRPYLYQLFASLPFALGWPIYLASLLGVALALRRHGATDRVLLVGLGAYFVLLGQTNVVFPRYLIPLFPALAVLAGRALVELRMPRTVRLAACVAIVGYGFALGFSEVDRFSYDQQLSLSRWLRASFPLELHPRIRVVVPREMENYFGLREPLRRVGIRQRTAATGHWLDGRPDAFVLPEWRATSIRRDRKYASARDALARLESGRAGYREVGRWRSSYLQQGFYTWLDPAFATDLYMGEIGFRVYLRDDLVTVPPAPAADRR